MLQDKLQIKDLRVGVIVSSDIYPIAIMSLDGTFRFAKKNVLKNIEIGQIIFFEDKKDDIISYMVPITKFVYFKNLRGLNRDDYDSYLYKEKGGLCVPKIALKESDSFIVNNGSGYQFIVYHKTPLRIYADWRYTDEERELIETFFERPNEQDYDALLLSVDEYITTHDFNKVIESFEIFNEEFYHSRPGKDDYYYIEKKCTTFEDGYINSLFPIVGGEVYRDHGWCSYSALRVDFERRAYMEEEQEAIAAAKEKYSISEHRRFLISQALKKRDAENYAYSRKKERVIRSFVKEYTKLICHPKVCFPFVKSLNELLRSFYRGLYNSNIEGHNFFNAITRD